jgi:hypothetical protein
MLINSKITSISRSKTRAGKLKIILQIENQTTDLYLFPKVSEILDQSNPAVGDSIVATGYMDTRGIYQPKNTFHVECVYESVEAYNKSNEIDKVEGDTISAGDLVIIDGQQYCEVWSNLHVLAKRDISHDELTEFLKLKESENPEIWHEDINTAMADFDGFQILNAVYMNIKPVADYIDGSDNSVTKLQCSIESIHTDVITNSESD